MAVGSLNVHFHADFDQWNRAMTWLQMRCDLVTMRSKRRRLGMPLLRVTM